MKLTIELDREVDGRWIAEVRELNVLLYGHSKRDAIQRAQSRVAKAAESRSASGGYGEAGLSTGKMVRRSTSPARLGRRAGLEPERGDPGQAGCDGSAGIMHGAKQIRRHDGFKRHGDVFVRRPA